MTTYSSNTRAMPGPGDLGDDPRLAGDDLDDAIGMDEIIREIRTWLGIAAVADLAGDRGKAMSAIREIAVYATDCTED
jgi:hypothetical protein